MMSARTRAVLLWVAVLLPGVPVSFGIARGEWRLRTGASWLFDITGYDPRDLLRGRYMQFRIEAHEDGGGCPDEGPCCYCLTRGARAEPPRAQPMACEDARGCDGFVDREALHGLRRYYVPEEHAARAEALLRKSAADKQARLEVAVDGAGQPHIKELWVSGRRLSDALAR